jgi:hypothetical protein
MKVDTWRVVALERGKVMRVSARTRSQPPGAGTDTLMD